MVFDADGTKIDLGINYGGDVIDEKGTSRNTIPSFLLTISEIKDIVGFGKSPPRKRSEVMNILKDRFQSMA